MSVGGMETRGGFENPLVEIEASPEMFKRMGSERLVPRVVKVCYPESFRRLQMLKGEKPVMYTNGVLRNH